MADIPEQCGGPLSSKTVDAAQGESIGAGHLLPDQQSQAISPVEVPRILDLLMLANAIETHRLGQFHVTSQSMPIRRGHAAVGPVPLIEDQSQLKSAVIQNEPVTFDPDGAQRRVTEDLVDDLAVRSKKAQCRVDQGR